MKKWLGFIVLLVLLIPMPVMAMGVSPSAVNIDVPADGFTELVFTITGCSEVDLSLEGIPLTVEPNHASVVGGQITVRILGNSLMPSGIYNGYLVILESGQQVGVGVKVSLTVNHADNQSILLTTTNHAGNQSVLLTTTILSSSGRGGGGWGGGYYIPPTDNTTIITPLVSGDITAPSYISPVVDEPRTHEPAEGIPMPTQRSTVNWGIVFLVGSAVLIVGLAGWYIWNNQKAKKKNLKQNQS